MAYHPSLPVWKNLLRQGLEDDGWQWDWTALGATDAQKTIKGRVVAKADGIWAADALVPATELLSQELGAPVKLVAKAKNGQLLKKGDVAVEWSGPAGAVLALERPFLNLASYAGGVATRTRKFVDAVAAAWSHPGEPPRVTPTRKTLPGYRDVAVLGVIAGGGFSHRVSLAGGVLIKENHVAAAGGIAKAIAGVRRIAPHGLKVEIETRSLDELTQALQAGADVVMLDNFTPAQAKQALELTRATSVVVEVSGGLDEANIGGYALPGVHILSSGSITLSVKATDLSMLFDGT